MGKRGNRAVTMPEASAIVYKCPACGRPIEPGENYVAAREYEASPDFSLHMAHR